METKLYTAEEIAKHNIIDGPNKSTWVSYEGKVYDITKFVNDHPGGSEVLADSAGTDVTRSFTEIGHSDHARGLMPPMCIGTLEGYVPGQNGARRTNGVNNKASNSSPHSNQSSGPSPLVIAILVIIVAIVAYGVVSST